MIAILTSKSEREGRSYLPTPRDIDRACRRIQAGWSPQERDKRAGRSPADGWTPPWIPLTLLLDAQEEERAGGWSWATDRNLR
jgi:hypothetical protein